MSTDTIEHQVVVVDEVDRLTYVFADEGAHERWALDGEQTWLEARPASDEELDEALSTINLGAE